MAILSKKNLLDDAPYTFTRASGASVRTFDKGIVQVGNNERRFDGQRRVENLTSSDLSTWTGSGGTHTKTFGVADPFGGNNAVTLTATSANAFIEYQQNDQDYYDGGNRRYSNRAWVRRRTGTGAIQMDGRQEAVDITTLLSDGEWHLISTQQNVSSTPSGDLFHAFKIDVAGDAIDVYQPMTEEVTGQSNTNPSEFVSNGELSAPYHGAGVDGVKYFPYQNANTVDGNGEITESKGIMITDIKGLLLEANRTNLLTYSEGNLSTYPSNSNVRDAATSIKGFDNSIEFYQSGVTSYTYKNYTTISGTKYAISVLIEMDDGNAPVYGTSTTTGDFSFVVDNSINTDPVLIEHMYDNIYRVSNVKQSSGAGNNIGVIKYSGQSSRTFRIAGIQLEQASYATSYIKTEASTATRAADSFTYELGTGNFPQEFQFSADVTFLCNGDDYQPSNVRILGTDDNRGVNNEVRSFADSTPVISYQGGGIAFTIDSDNILQGNTNLYVLSATTEGSNIRGLIQNNGVTEAYSAVVGTLDHTNTGTLQIGRYNAEVLSAYFKNIRLYSKD